MFVFLSSCLTDLCWKMFKAVNGDILWPWYDCEHVFSFLFFSLKWTELFPNDFKSAQESLLFVKRMMVVAVSSITYLRGIFPEDAYRSRYLEGEHSEKLARSLIKSVFGEKIYTYWMLHKVKYTYSFKNVSWSDNFRW